MYTKSIHIMAVTLIIAVMAGITACTAMPKGSTAEHDYTVGEVVVCNADEGNELRLDSCRQYICYEFGINNINKVFIAEGDSICDILIDDGKGKIFSTSCLKYAILKWAFDDMVDETSKYPANVNNIYAPIYYKLSILNGSSQTITNSSTLQIEYSKDVEKKIEELKVAIIKLWSSFFCKKQNMALA